MLLAEILKEQAQPGQVEASRRLVDALSASMPETRESSTEDALFRMSGLEKLCPRMHVLALRDGIPPESLDAEKRWILGTGTAFHRQFQEDYLQTLGDVFQGWWRCRRCGSMHHGEKLEGMLPYGWIPKPKLCMGPVCHKLGEQEHCDFEYVELGFWNDEHRISGHCDGVLVWAEDDIELLELKTINERGFTYVDPMLGGKPKSGHVIQCHGYLWGAEGTGAERVRVVYIKKSYEAMAQVLCEHVVKKRPEHIESIKKMLKDSAEGVQQVVEYLRLKLEAEGEGLEAPPESPVPDRLTECGKRSDSRARYCPAKSACFKKKR